MLAEIHHGAVVKGLGVYHMLPRPCVKLSHTVKLGRTVEEGGLEHCPLPCDIRTTCYVQFIKGTFPWV